MKEYVLSSRWPFVRKPRGRPGLETSLPSPGVRLRLKTPLDSPGTRLCLSSTGPYFPARNVPNDRRRVRLLKGKAEGNGAARKAQK